MPRTDVFGMTDQLDGAVLDVMVERLETRGAHPRFVAMMDEYLDAMAIDEANQVLDMGCGTGVVARAIAKRPLFRGNVTGIDLSGHLVAAATKLADTEQISDRVSFESGDTHSLGLADEMFDAVVAHTLFSHVKDPVAVLREAARTVRSGGAIGIFDGDFSSLSFESEFEPDAAKNDARLIASVSNQPRVMRRLPRLARDAGLRIENSFANVLTEVGQADFWDSSVRALGALLPKAGTMTQDEADAWTAFQLRASDENIFFGTSNYYAYVLRKP